MIFDVTATEEEILPIYRAFVAVTSWDPWAARLRSFQQQVKANPLMQEFIEQKYPIELQMERLHRRVQQGQPLKISRLASEVALLSFMTMVVRIYARLSEQGKNRFAGMLRGSLKNEDGLASLQHEMVVLVHLMREGFDVELSDIENGSGCDFIAQSGDLRIEVECKNFSADVGRKIHRRLMYQLGGKLLPLMQSAQTRSAGFQLVRIVVPNRLEASEEHTREILSAIERALENRAERLPLLSGGEVRYQVFDELEEPLASMSFGSFDREAIRRFLSDRFAISAAHAMVYGSKRGVIVINVESKQSDKFVDSLMGYLKAAVKGQLSGRYPAMLCVRFSDVKEDELKAIAQHDEAGGRSAIQMATSVLLSRQDWKPVHTIAYFASGLVERRGRSTHQGGLIYSFLNTAHEMATEPRLRELFYQQD